MIRRITQFLLLSMLLALLLVSTGAYYWEKSLNKPISGLVSNQLIVVERGTSLTRFVQEMSQRGVFSHPRIMRWYLRWYRPSFVLKAGEYHLTAGMSENEFLRGLEVGDVVQHRITMVEGENLNAMLKRLGAADALRHTVPQGIAMGALAKQLGIDLDHLEGWFLPETYQYTRGSSDVDLLRRMHSAMVAVLESEWSARDEGLPYSEAFEALIMASLVEKETGVAEERRQIAGVFVRRLQKGMRLQTDPSVIYGLGAEYTGNLTRRHLREDTAYNSYTRHGLPPTPIAMPGREAIHAALHPTSGTALYFVAKGDGSHKFSDTLEEHREAVQHYQVLRRRADYQSSPARAGKIHKG